MHNTTSHSSFHHSLLATAILLASMPAYEEIYPHGIVHKVWPMELVPGESDDTRPTG